MFFAGRRLSHRRTGLSAVCASPGIRSMALELALVDFFRPDPHMPSADPRSTPLSAVRCPRAGHADGEGAHRA